MSKINSGEARIVNDAEKNLEIVVSTKLHKLLTILAVLWFEVWILGEVFVIKRLVTGAVSGLNIFLAVGWTVGGLFIILFILWNIVGKEVITLSDKELQIERKILILNLKEEYTLSEIKKNQTDAS